MTTRTDHIRGLDSIRFICALWVVFGHFGGPFLPAWIDKGTPLGWVIHGIYANVFSGPAAVIVFFVVSGFCIHYPHREGLRVPSLASFYIRRYVRIVIPMVAAIFISVMMGHSFKLFENSILWSLFAELVYYSIYPLLLILRRIFTSWRPLIAVFLTLSLLMVIVIPDGLGSSTPGDYPVYGIWLNWLLGLPCWLVGCAVAEATGTSTDKPRYGIWTLRLAILGAAAICSVLRFHTPISYPWTLNFFALLVGYWLLQEVRTPPQPSTVSRLLEWAGSWSYSLYLTHGLGRTIFVLLLSDQVAAGNVAWLAQTLTILAVAVVFAYLFEFSAHRLARFLGRRAMS
jgi:peptidoglycan/LPS O-acetylase OafA/YrhL